MLYAKNEAGEPVADEFIEQTRRRQLLQARFTQSILFSTRPLESGEVKVYIKSTAEQLIKIANFYKKKIETSISQPNIKKDKSCDAYGTVDMIEVTFANDEECDDIEDFQFDRIEPHSSDSEAEEEAEYETDDTDSAPSEDGMFVDISGENGQDGQFVDDSDSSDGDGV